MSGTASPMLTLAGADVLGYQGTRHHKLAAAVEFIHTATLLHDDVVDESDLRRGNRTANALYGNAAAVFVGEVVALASSGGTPGPRSDTRTAMPPPVRSNFSRNRDRTRRNA